MKFGKDFSSVALIVVVGVEVVGCFDLSQQTFLSAWLQIRLFSLAKIDLYAELLFPFSASTFFKSPSFDLYDTQISFDKHV